MVETNEIEKVLADKKGRSIRIRIETGIFVGVSSTSDYKKGRSIRIRIETQI